VLVHGSTKGRQVGIASLRLREPHESGVEPAAVALPRPDLTGNLLEVVAIIRTDESLVVHAMAMKPECRHLLP